MPRGLPPRGWRNRWPPAAWCSATTSFTGSACGPDFGCSVHLERSDQRLASLDSSILTSEILHPRMPQVRAVIAIPPTDCSALLATLHSNRLGTSRALSVDDGRLAEGKSDDQRIERPAGTSGSDRAEAGWSHSVCRREIRSGGCRNCRAARVYRVRVRKAGREHGRGLRQARFEDGRRVRRGRL